MRIWANRTLSLYSGVQAIVTVEVIFEVLLCTKGYLSTFSVVVSGKGIHSMRVKEQVLNTELLASLQLTGTNSVFDASQVLMEGGVDTICLQNTLVCDKSVILGVQKSPLHYCCFWKIRVCTDIIKHMLSLTVYCHARGICF